MINTLVQNHKRSANNSSHEEASAQTLQGLIKTLVLLALFTLAITWLCRGLLDVMFDIQMPSSFWHRDYLGNLSVTLVCFLLVQHTGKAVLLGGILILGFQLSNGAKLSILGTPVSPDDMINVQNLFYLTDGWRRVLMFAIAALPLLLAALLIPFKKVSTWFVLLTILIGCMIIRHYSVPLRVYLDGQFGNSVWNQPENFKRRGLALHIAQESIRTLAKVGKYPDEETVMAATNALPQLHATSAVSPPSANARQRNVHIIVLESFFDPLSLGPEWVTTDPFPESFRSLWAQTGQSKALSPVFGGYTANAEFETLCGFPVTENAVFFEGWLRRKAPCLPAILADAGYQTIASHPNVPGFWNRTLAYQLVGFEHYLSKAHFNLEDSVGGLLLDHSYYQQVFRQLESKPALQTDQPVLNYMLTYHGHLPYPSNDKYPDKVEAAQDAPLLHGYLNHLWYKSRDLMNRLKTLREEDPDALIVVFGDHLPFLGPNYGVYSQALNLPADRAEFNGDMLEYLVSTPLIVIDGQRGPLELGKMPLYQLPDLILELLGNSRNKDIFNWTENPKDTLIRPVYGMHIALSEDKAIACPDDDSAPQSCTISSDWLARTRLLISDIFTGKQHSLNRLEQGNDS